MTASASITISHIADGLTTFYEYAQNSSNTTAPATGWSESPPSVEVGQFIWRREGTALTKDEITIWHTICLTGPKGEPGEEGPSGAPGTLGVNTDGSVIQVAGFDSEGVFGQNVGIMHIGSQRISVPYNEYEFGGTGSGYIVLTNGNTIEFVKLIPVGGGAEPYRLAWLDFNSNVEVAPNYVIGRFLIADSVVLEANLHTPLQTETFLKANLMELLVEANKSGDINQLEKIAVAMGADRIFQILVAQQGFIRELWVNKLQSNVYEENNQGVPIKGFKLDGDTGLASITGLIANQAEITGTFKNQGFKTLEPYAGVSIDVQTIDPTIFKFSEMYELIPSESSLQSLAGTIEGFSFTQATRRSDQRVLLTSDTDQSYVWMSSGVRTIVKKSTPTTLFGRSYLIEWHFDGSNFWVSRYLLRVRPTDSNSKIYSDLSHQTTVGDGEEANTYYTYRDDMTLWSGSNGSGTYSGTYSTTSERSSIVTYATTGALWGGSSVYVNYMKVWTGKKFTALVLSDGSTYKEIVNQPNAYYLSSGKSFSVGSTNQNSATIKKYRSGTDFYNLFGTLAVGAIGSVSSGKIKINGTEYIVNKLQKSSDRITFWTNDGEKTVQMFTNGTSTGVYTELAITSAIVFAPIEGGVESMHILPINGANNTYDIGQNTKRFRTGYFNDMYANVGYFHKLAFPSISGTATFTRSSNQIDLTGITANLGLEVGDVIRVSGASGNNKVFTVEGVGANYVNVNYEHRAGSGSLSLVDGSGSCTIELVSKWYNAPLGLGQAWVAMTSKRNAGTTYTNTTNRLIACSIGAYATSKTTAYIYITVDGHSMLATDEDHQTTGSSNPTALFVYKNSYVINSWSNKARAFELR